MENPYYSIEFSRKEMSYAFTSTGKNGNILKAVFMQYMDMPETPRRFNLAIADVIDGKFSFHHVTDNRDHEKLAGTLFQIVSDFFMRYPGSEIFLTGSTPARTRLYQMQISKNLENIPPEFVIFGYKSNGGPCEQFKKGENYVAFWVTRL